MLTQRLGRAITAGVIIAGVGAAATKEPALAATPCKPPGGPTVSPVTSTRPTTSGSEVTEYAANGRYRVTRCNAAGTVERSQTVFEAPVPDGGHVRLIESDYHRDGSRLLGVSPVYPDLRGSPGQELYEKSGAVWRAQVLPPSDEALVKSARRLAPRTAPSNCSSSSWNGTGLKWVADFTYVRFNLSNMYDPNSDMRNSLTRGYEAWNFTRNPCGQADQHNFDFIALADTAALAGPINQDGINAVDINSLGSTIYGSCYNAIGCTWTWASGSALIEFDMRLNSDVCLWGTASGSTSVPGGCFDIQGVAAHEFGHAMGLAHTDNFGDTMYRYVYPSNCSLYSCEDYAVMPRDLALSDITGMRAAYPNH